MAYKNFKASYEKISAAKRRERENEMYEDYKVEKYEARACGDFDFMTFDAYLKLMS